MDALTLPLELERFAEEAVAAGRYRDVTELVVAGLDLLRQRETARVAFIAALEDARAEGERDGLLTAEEVEADVRAAIAATASATATPAA